MIRDQIWVEIKTVKTYLEACLFYTDKRRKSNRAINLVLIAVAFIGPLCMTFSLWVSFASSLLVGVLELIKNVSSTFVQSEEELNQLDQIAESYTCELVSLEHLWNFLGLKKYDDEFFIDELLKLQKMNAVNEVKMNKYMRRLSKRDNKNCQEKVEMYLKSKFYGEVSIKEN